MDNFENIRSQWGNRDLPPSPESGPQMAISKAEHLKRKQLIGQIVLSLTVIILIGFFFYVSAYNSGIVSLGLGMMIGSLVVRIIVEYISQARLRKLSVMQEVDKYKKALISYYTSRKWIHYLLTPVVFIIYFTGFALLLPSFEQSLSPGFYNYILYSSIFIFLFFAVFIWIQVKRELTMLKELKGDN